MIRCLLYAGLLCSGVVQAEWKVSTDFPGGSAKVEVMDAGKGRLEIRPAAHAGLGWECWWSFKLSGIKPGELVTLRVSGMDFALPERASFSYDGSHWQQTQVGKVEKGHVTYELAFDRSEVWLAWGPPFQLSDAQALIQRTVARGVGASAFELTRSKGGLPVPAMKWTPVQKKGRGLWLEARQHAWESGSSWVCAGLVDWLCSDDAAAKELRESSTIVVVPIMDVDNVEQGAGGKDQTPHDHNRDWSPTPVWNAVKEAQKQIKALDEEGELSLFLDLHNPAPRDLKPFFFVSPASLLSPARASRQQEWLAIAGEFLGAQPLGLSEKTRESGPGYHPLWKQISKNWVTENTRDGVVALTLETSWNTPHSTQAGYQDYGAALGRAVARYVTGAAK